MKLNLLISTLGAILLLAFLVTYFGCATTKNLGSISYNSHVRPILSDKCFTCHGPDENKREAGLRLDIEEDARSLLESGAGVAIDPGRVETSLLVERILTEDIGEVMPPPESNLSLTEDEKEILTNWIRQGGNYEPHWSFAPIKQGEIPNSKSRWSRNSIDNYIEKKAIELGLKTSKDEDEHLLIKRMYHDVIGLPPSGEEILRYTEDADKETAYEKLLDEALANPHFGEKWAILWMDLARYADSHGYQDDGYRTMWPWRDWVIHAFNENYSYKKFITWQLAGDLIPEKSTESILATGFNRNHKITQEGGVIGEEYRIEYVTDRTNTFGKGILGLTLECAKCHSHKYDPITQEEYYSTFAFFDKVPEVGLYGDIFSASLADPPFITIHKSEVDSILNFINLTEGDSVDVMIMKDDPKLRKTHILDRGLYDQKTDVVSTKPPAAVKAFDQGDFEMNRRGLAEWLFADDHPLTSRVFVNLIWQEIFGRGIVNTSGDFGLQGDLPSHPELLDHLAYEFKQDWDIKKLIKKILMSSTYRQSSVVAGKSGNLDPDNIYLARGPRKKLSAELLKDHILASSGLLNREIGGPSVKPYQPEGLWKSASSGRGALKEYEQDKGDKLYRRGLYHFVKRTTPPPSMLVFDASNRDQCEVKRTETNTPLQSLVLLNDPQVLESSRFFAQQIVDQYQNIEDQLDLAFFKILCRPITGKERNVLSKFYNEFRDDLSEDRAKQLLDVGEWEKPEKNHTEIAALMQTIQIMYNLEETSMR